jgi:hypothetical protein
MMRAQDAGPETGREGGEAQSSSPSLVHDAMLLVVGGEGEHHHWCKQSEGGRRELLWHLPEDTDGQVRWWVTPVRQGTGTQSCN